MNDYLTTRELYHHGTKGQKWGIRKYQNYDGTLTDAGRLRYAGVSKEDYEKLSAADKAKIDKAGISNLETASRKSEVASTIAKEARSIASSAQTFTTETRGSKAIRKDYSDLSNEELQKRVNRLNLERTYGDLTGETKYVKTGKEKARELLQTIGASLAVVGSAIGIYRALFGQDGFIKPGKGK